MLEVHGYITRIRPRRVGATIALHVSISTLSGECYETLVHDPPDWLDLGSKITAHLERIPGRSELLYAATGLKPSESLPDTLRVDVTVESIRETPDGHVLIEGRRSDGGLFSYLLTPESADLSGITPPYKAIALKTLQHGSERVIAVVSQRNLKIMARAREIILQLKEVEEERPELGFLPNPP